MNWLQITGVLGIAAAGYIYLKKQVTTAKLDLVIDRFFNDKDVDKVTFTLDGKNYCAFRDRNDWINVRTHESFSKTVANELNKFRELEMVKMTRSIKPKA